jgi:pilus assembly protein TadC
MENPPPNLFQSLFTPTPELKRKLKIAHMMIEPKKFIRRSLAASAYFAIAISTVMFFIMTKQTGKPALLPFYVFPFVFFLFYAFMMATPNVYIRRRERDINRNIVFATRYLILKMDSGQPLLNSMISASHSYGIGGKFFGEIVDDVQLGKPIEQALEEAHKYSSSHLFQLVLRQILNALKSGIDVTESLKKILDEITRQQQIEIKEYSKKLNSLVLFYLLMACVFPSLGICMFLVVGSMIGLIFDVKVYFLIIFLLIFINLVFIGLVKSMKPTVDI